MNKARALIENIASALTEADLSKKDGLQKHEALKKEAEIQSKSIDDKSKKALATYTNKGYTYINSTLRGTNSTHPSHGKKPALEKIENLKKVTNNTTKHSFKTYRGLKKNTHGALKEGEIIHDKGFTSTSLDPYTAKGSFNKGAGERFIVNVKPGTKGFYAGHDHTLENAHEKEFILHPGTKFKVGKKETDNEGTEWTHLSIHSQED